MSFYAVMLRNAALAFVGRSICWPRGPCGRFSHLIHTVRSITDTGIIQARMPVGQTGDELDELARLFNQMLDQNRNPDKGYERVPG